MKILKLQNTTISPAKAIVRKNKDNDKLYFYIPHGTRSKDLFCYNMALSYKDFIPKNEQDELELIGNGYNIVPAIRDGKIIKDKLNNTIYVITKDNNTSHAEDIILFWEIPNKKYTDVVLKSSGDIDIIARGYSGKLRGDKLYKSDAPILEIYGDCECEWKGVDTITGKVIGQALKYTYATNEWNIVNI